MLSIFCFISSATMTKFTSRLLSIHLENIRKLKVQLKAYEDKKYLINEFRRLSLQSHRDHDAVKFKFSTTNRHFE